MGFESSLVATIPPLLQQPHLKCYGLPENELLRHLPLPRPSQYGGDGEFTTIEESMFTQTKTLLNDNSGESLMVWNF
ncbi:hypothetical protein SESBI_41732 [Sesbania bispinosa]|nr:hypothetical protein SESBI_41732 [Sesbania bispinosa]